MLLVQEARIDKTIAEIRDEFYRIEDRDFFYNDSDSNAFPMAAAAYAAAACDLLGYASDLWPYGDVPLRSLSRRDNLLKAGALILAELERLDRLEQNNV